LSGNGRCSPSAASKRPQALLFEVLAGELDGRRRHVHAGDLGAAPGEARKVHAGPAADVKNRSAAIAVKVHEPEQVMELFEMILVEIVEEAARTDGMPRDLQVVNVPVPVLTDLRRRRHVSHYTATAFGSQPVAISPRQRLRTES